jgi:hypothetical protein
MHWCEQSFRAVPTHDERVSLAELDTEDVQMTPDDEPVEQRDEQQGEHGEMTAPRPTDRGPGDRGGYTRVVATCRAIRLSS